MSFTAESATSVVGSPLPNVHQLCPRQWKGSSTCVNIQTFNESISCRRTSTNDHLELSTTATFWADSPYIQSCFNLSTTTTFLQWPLVSVPKVAVLPEKLYNTLWTSLFSQISQEKNMSSSTLVILPVNKPAMFSKSQSKPN